MTQILIARHGNTFDPGDKVVRLGPTDMPLSSSGKIQAEKLGLNLKARNLRPAAVFASNLSRTIQTASIALSVAGITLPIQENAMFNEVDYGPDEGKTDQEIIARVGEQALSAWDKDALPPPGWLVQPQEIIQNWFNFAAMALKDFPTDVVLVVTSNGIARFAPYLTGDFQAFSQTHKIKMATGALSCLRFDGERWSVEFWNNLV